MKECFRIGKTCTVTTIEEGRNDFWPLFGAILITLLCFALFYLGRFLYNRFWRKSTDNTENNDEVSKKVSQRLKSLDAFRGYDYIILFYRLNFIFNYLTIDRITILFMIFVNWGAGEYHILDHAEWDGLHFAEFIFPAFIFIMGVTMAIRYYLIKICTFEKKSESVFSLRSAVVNKNIPLGSIYWTIIKRSIKLFLVGLFLGSKGNGMPILIIDQLNNLLLYSRYSLCSNTRSVATFQFVILICGVCARNLSSYEQT